MSTQYYKFFQKFYPKVVYDENHEVDENELKTIIGKGDVSDAITVYKLLSKKNIGNSMHYIIN